VLIQNEKILNIFNTIRSITLSFEFLIVAIIILILLLSSFLPLIKFILYSDNTALPEDHPCKVVMQAENLSGFDSCQFKYYEFFRFESTRIFSF